MSSDSDTDHDAEIKKFMEAADTTLLTNSMFQQKDEKELPNLTHKHTVTLTIDLPKSQRTITEENENCWTDFKLPESTQKHLAKKFCEILKEHYEFCDVTTHNSATKTKNKYKNRVKLLKGADCYVNPYEDFEYDTKGPEKKSVLKRRIVDDLLEYNANEEEKLKSVAVDGNDILSCKEIKTWAKKKERRDKIFHYKMASTGIAHAIEETNEFTEIRRKNKWKECKIKSLKTR